MLSPSMEDLFKAMVAELVSQQTLVPLGLDLRVNLVLPPIGSFSGPLKVE